MSSTILIVLGVGGGVGVLGLAAWWFWPAGGCNHDCNEPRYQADRGDPTRRWVHGVLALYRGDAGDPAYWDASCATTQAASWGMETPEDLYELLTRYHHGEINPAFDKARLMWLARLGQGVGWLSEAQSWEWCRSAANALQQHYPGWNEVFQDLDRGRSDWHDGQVPPEERQRAIEHFQFASSQVLPHVPFR